MKWGRGFVQLTIKRSTLYRYNQYQWDGRLSGDELWDLIDQQYGGDYEMYFGAREGEKRRVEVFIQRCEREHPILKKLGPTEGALYGLYGHFLWITCPDDEHDREAQYQQLRNEAWAIWKHIPNLAKEFRVEIDMFWVRPLPGPWRWRFL